ncbi:TetR/AcrR family transcriptional regulator [Nocardioides anomalus]|uniref:TetR/AcrR family transcriptional regulator n=1 Tax=Nocardioides anomalus TaxID=2712223 RepID=A0A6G6WFX0_9ACTN|nr:TetR/AcrR family transcriptional regulator [Nocardioides anomalus]QIG44106.1 TetR/AcrR family transcriptional regulator [Nocardioides anomalus]
MTGLRSDARRNHEQLARAAVTALHREGHAVPMTTIAAEAGVGVGTLYRHFPSREDLLDELTRRSFERMLARLEAVGAEDAPATDLLRSFLTGVIADRDDLLLPSTGGPAVRTDATRAVQRRLHDAIGALLARGAADGTIRRPVDVWDIAWLGATLAPPGRPGPAWDEVAGRLLETYLAGLGAPPGPDPA